MYCLNSNQILATKIDLFIVMSRPLNDLWLYMQATTINLALTLKIPIRNDSKSRPFQTMGTSFVLCCINNNDGPCYIILQERCDDSLLITPNWPNMLSTLSYL